MRAHQHQDWCVAVRSFPQRDPDPVAKDCDCGGSEVQLYIRHLEARLIGWEAPR